jgi:hypothetical protein
MLKTPSIPHADREICVGISTTCSAIGITLAGLFTLLIQNTFLADK